MIQAPHGLLTCQVRHTRIKQESIVWHKHAPQALCQRIHEGEHRHAAQQLGSACRQGCKPREGASPPVGVGGLQRNRCRCTFLAQKINVATQIKIRT